jgi:menaquinol-cytochrome c reductase iron-sulfur subunit
VRTVLAEATEPGTTRRRFYLGAIYTLWGIISAALGLPAIIYLFFPPRAHHEDEWVDAGDVSRLDPKTPMEVVFRRNRVDGWKLISEKSTAWVAKLPTGQIVAYGPQCTHLGCAYHWDESKTEFICPCHSSIFSVDGKVVAGPAPRPLDRYESRIEGNKLMLGRLLEGETNKA